MKNSTLFKIGFVIVIVAQFFAAIETIHYGSNWLPESMNEFICDFIAAFMVGFGGALIFVALMNNAIEEFKEIKRKFNQ